MKRNKDLNDIKLLKVELQKLEVLYRKYKEIVPLSSTSQFNQLDLPELLDIHEGMETEDLLIHIQRVKNQLQNEIFSFRRQEQMDKAQKMEDARAFKDKVKNTKSVLKTSVKMTQQEKKR